MTRTEKEREREKGIKWSLLDFVFLVWEVDLFNKRLSLMDTSSEKGLRDTRGVGF